jgi:hypothetical protein
MKYSIAYIGWKSEEGELAWCVSHRRFNTKEEAMKYIEQVGLPSEKNPTVVQLNSGTEYML